VFVQTPGFRRRVAHIRSDHFSEQNHVGGPFSYAYALNDRGQVVGSSSTPEGSHAFSWTAAAGMVDLGTLGANYAYAYAVNNHGQVVGVSARLSLASSTTLSPSQRRIPLESDD
jgi:probable HAF family extracellular repeat protein